jgi:hypothetical protein
MARKRLISPVQRATIYQSLICYLETEKWILEHTDELSTQHYGLCSYLREAAYSLLSDSFLLIAFVNAFEGDNILFQLPEFNKVKPRPFFNTGDYWWPKGHLVQRIHALNEMIKLAQKARI